MKPQDFPEDVRSLLIPRPSGKLVYRCLGCGAKPSIERLAYTCPECGAVMLIEDEEFDRLKKNTWPDLAEGFRLPQGPERACV